MSHSLVLHNRKIAKRVQRIRAVTLGSLGFSVKFIQSETGLSAPVIKYELKQHNIRLRDYRDGDSRVSKKVRETALNALMPIVNKVLEKRNRLLIK